MKKKQYTAMTLFSGLGGGALGLQEAGFELVGGFDAWGEAIEDYEMLTGSRGHVVDLANLQPHELRARVGARRPDVVLTSPPCKGFSSCLPAERATDREYIQLNSLAERGIWLTLEAWETPPPVILLENVPRIQSRGRSWLDAIGQLLRAYGYVLSETTHDCGVLGGLGQSRRRFLLIARRPDVVPEFIYEPPKYPLRGCGEVLKLLPTPAPVKDDEVPPGGALHRLGRMSPLNWLRLALIPAGGDWRDLPASVLTGSSHDLERGARAAHSDVTPPRVSRTDPRLGCTPRATVYGVCPWGAQSGTVIAWANHDNGAWSVADPRVTCHRREGAEGVTPWGEPSTTVIAHGTHFNGPWQVADPREAGLACATHQIVQTQGGRACLGPGLDLETRRPDHTVIRALDGTWHRPMTTLELAALQSLPVWHDGAWLNLAGGSKSRWRQRIGNAIPPATAAAIGRTILRSLEASDEGLLLMGGEPVWVDGARALEEASSP